MGSLSSMISSDRGFHVLPEAYTAPLAAHPGIVIRVLPGFKDVFEIGIVRSKNRELRPSVDDLVDFVVSGGSLLKGV